MNYIIRIGCSSFALDLVSPQKPSATCWPSPSSALTNREELNRIFHESGVKPTRRCDLYKPGVERRKLEELGTNVGDLFSTVTEQYVGSTDEKEKACIFCNALLNELTSRGC